MGGSSTVSASIGFEFGGIGASTDVEFSQEKSWSQEFTTSDTRSSDSTWSQEVRRTSEVSRSRTVSVPEFTVVDVNDAIMTVRNVRIPFTQLLRVTGLDLSASLPMTGEEIATQITSNIATCLITDVGADSVLVSIRGVAQVDQMFNASTLVQEIPGSCH